MINALELNQIKPLSYSSDRAANISLGGIPVAELAKTYGTPLYVVCERTIEERSKAYKQAFSEYYPNSMVIYASKALNCKAVCKIVAEQGLGIDVVSAGELYTALAVGFPVDRIIFHGNNKSEQELEMAIDSGIYAIVLDNFYELGLLEKILKRFPDKRIGLLVRVTPGIECHTHEYIKTGKIDSKFGFNIAELDEVVSRLVKQSQIELRGLHAHIGSQIFETTPHNDTVEVLLKLYQDLQNKFNISFTDLNVGGGLGIMYVEQDDPPAINTWVKTITDAVQSNCAKLNLKQPKILVEPGRSLVGPAGATIYQVGNIKNIPGLRKYVAVDGGMADNVRPIMYQAKYCAELNARSGKTELVTIAGKYCESGDILIHDVELPIVSSGDLLVVYSTGAYNYSMSSNYNRACRPAMIGVKNGQARILVKRESLEDLLRLDS